MRSASQIDRNFLPFQQAETTIVVSSGIALIGGKTETMRCTLNFYATKPKR
jgi:hypothetical protein